MFPYFKWFPLFIGCCSILSLECYTPSKKLPGQCNNCSIINLKGEKVHNENVGCHCQRKPGCKLLPMTTEELGFFRETAFRKHNERRLEFADGIGDLQSVADMMELGQYYGDLEYTSMCSALRCPKAGEHQKCLGTDHFKVGVGQNVWSNWTDRAPYKNLSKRALIEQIFDDALQSWHNEIVYFPRELVSTFIPSQDYRSRNRSRNSYDAFTCMYWARVQRVGCYISMRLGTFDRVIEHILVCNYGDWEFKPCNIPGEPFYTPGETCSQCPSCKISNCCAGKVCSYEDKLMTHYNFEHLVGPTLPELKPSGHREIVKELITLNKYQQSKAEKYIPLNYELSALLFIISVLL